MLERAAHFLSGYAEFEVRGDAARFFTICARSGFDFWGFSRREGVPGACCRAREYKRLRPLARRCRVRLRCVQKGGLPFLTRRLRKRPGLPAGVLCGIALYAFLSSFVWGVSVTGTETLGDCLVLEAARECGVAPGVSRRGLEPKVAAKKLAARLPGLKNAAVNTNGCFVEIAVGEAEKKPEIADDDRWSNMVALRPGTILSVEAEHGRPEVRPGDTVEEGDLLISGLYQEQLEPWDPRADQPWKTLGAARGRVIAETYREFTVCVSAEKKELVPTGKKQTDRTLELFGMELPLGLHGAPGGEYRAYREDSVLTALETELPVVLRRQVYELLEERTRTLSEEELKEAALLKLRELQRDILPDGSSVRKEELSFCFPEGMCILTAKCRCREEIGKVLEIRIEPSGENLVQ